MKSRKEIKALAKTAFSARYWTCVGTVVLVWLVLSAASGISCGVGTLLLTGPMTIGLNFFCVSVFMNNPDASVGTAFTNAFQNYGRKLGGFLWMQLFLFLWSLLFVIPGIIKSFSYAMTPFILSDCPCVKATDALKLSMRMMRGHKWQLFVFYLSFIGWGILTCLTGGLLGVFYVTPWLNTAAAGWYLELREDCLRTGVIAVSELDGGPLLG